ncbi:MAG: MinD/ParA family protein [Phycisphaerae bacterium]|jgi:flagellar biosynthesis protein FlhG
MAPFDNPGGDQAQRLRRLMLQDDRGGAQPPAHAHVIAVASGKGGVGKTLISANLSIALAARGHAVVLIDLDMGLANADIVLGVNPACTWSEALSGRRTVEDVIVQAPGGIAFVPGPSGVARMANLSEFERYQLMSLMQRIESRYDVVVLDCGAGLSQNVLALVSSADTLLVVTTPEPTALTDAYAVIKTVSRVGREGETPASAPGAVGVIVNNAESRREALETFERLAGTAARFLHLPVTDFGYVLHDDHVRSAVRRRRPVVLAYPRCPASACLMACAVKLSAELGRPEGAQSLFYRVMSMFV